ncbi:elongator complex protein 6 isoform X3 [Heterodontus francisci]|uniref:elongator complex protein 6 isoform X3 n=1 Tax=Heterodontus francisci TaxID=7792 RepID=UPI00355C82B4
MAVSLYITSFPFISKGVNLSAAREKGQLVFLEALRSSVDFMLGDRQDSTPHTLSPLQFLRMWASLARLAFIDYPKFNTTEWLARVKGQAAMPCHSHLNSSPNASLQPLYEFICISLLETSKTTWKFPVLIIDDLSVLLSLGVSTVNILNFMHYCRATVCSKLMGNLVMMVHDTEDLEDEENNFVVKSLSHQCHLILQVEGLTTGYCKDIHGQLKMACRSPSPVKSEKNVTKIFQYKIQDKNVTFFARGTSSAVL